MSMEMFSRVSPHNLHCEKKCTRVKGLCNVSRKEVGKFLTTSRSHNSSIQILFVKTSSKRNVTLSSMYAYNQVVVKMLIVKKNHLLLEDPQFEARTRLMYEAHNLCRLSASRHPNFPVLLGFDTKSMPYHIITAFECWGNFRTFLQRLRDVESRDQAVDLLWMLDDVVYALSHLEELGLVHRCVNAENILVGDNFVCKLSGLHSLRRLTLETAEQGILMTKIFAEYRTRVHLYIRKQIGNCDFRPSQTKIQTT